MPAPRIGSHVLLALFSLAASHSAPAGIYRCLEPDGRVGYADHACPPGAAQQEVEQPTRSNAGQRAPGILEANRELLESFDARLARERERAQNARSARVPEGDGSADPPRPPLEAEAAEYPPPFDYYRPPHRHNKPTYGPPSRFPRNPRAPMNLR